MTRVGWSELGEIVAQESDLGSGGHQDHLEAGGEAQLPPPGMRFRQWAGAGGTFMGGNFLRKAWEGGDDSGSGQ